MNTTPVQPPVMTHSLQLAGMGSRDQIQNLVSSLAKVQTGSRIDARVLSTPDSNNQPYRIMIEGQSLEAKLPAGFRAGQSIGFELLRGKDGIELKLLSRPEAGAVPPEQVSEKELLTRALRLSEQNIAEIGRALKQLSAGVKQEQGAQQVANAFQEILQKVPKELQSPDGDARVILKSDTAASAEKVLALLQSSQSETRVQVSKNILAVVGRELSANVSPEMRAIAKEVQTRLQSIPALSAALTQTSPSAESEVPEKLLRLLSQPALRAQPDVQEAVSKMQKVLTSAAPSQQALREASAALQKLVQFFEHSQDPTGRSATTASAPSADSMLPTKTREILQQLVQLKELPAISSAGQTNFTNELARFVRQMPESANASVSQLHRILESALKQVNREGVTPTEFQQVLESTNARAAPLLKSLAGAVDSSAAQQSQSNEKIIELARRVQSGFEIKSLQAGMHELRSSQSSQTAVQSLLHLLKSNFSESEAPPSVADLKNLVQQQISSLKNFEGRVRELLTGARSAEPYDLLMKSLQDVEKRMPGQPATQDLRFLEFVRNLRQDLQAIPAAEIQSERGQRILKQALEVLRNDFLAKDSSAGPVLATQQVASQDQLSVDFQLAAKKIDAQLKMLIESKGSSSFSQTLGDFKQSLQTLEKLPARTSADQKLLEFAKQLQQSIPDVVHKDAQPALAKTLQAHHQIMLETFSPQLSPGAKFKLSPQTTELIAKLDILFRTLLEQPAKTALPGAPGMDALQKAIGSLRSELPADPADPLAFIKHMRGFLEKGSFEFPLQQEVAQQTQGFFKNLQQQLQQRVAESVASPFESKLFELLKAIKDLPPSGQLPTEFMQTLPRELRTFFEKVEQGVFKPLFELGRSMQEFSAGDQGRDVFASQIADARSRVFEFMKHAPDDQRDAIRVLLKSAGAGELEKVLLTTENVLATLGKSDLSLRAELGRLSSNPGVKELISFLRQALEGQPPGSAADQRVAGQLQELLTALMQLSDDRAQSSPARNGDLTPARLAELVSKFGQEQQDSTQGPSRTNAQLEALRSVENLMKGQEMLRQLNPLMQAVGEPAVLLFPSLLPGMLAQLEVILYPPGQEQGDKGKGKKNKESQRASIQLEFASLGKVRADIRTTGRDIDLEFYFDSKQTVEFARGFTPMLRRALAKQGKQKISVRMSQAAPARKPANWLDLLQDPDSIIA